MGRRERIFALKKGGIVFKNINPCRRDGGGEMRRKKVKRKFFVATILACVFSLVLVGCGGEDKPADPEAIEVRAKTVPQDEAVAGDVLIVDATGTRYLPNPEQALILDVDVASQPDGSKMGKPTPSGAYKWVCVPKISGNYTFLITANGHDKNQATTQSVEILVKPVTLGVSTITANSITFTSTAGTDAKFRLHIGDTYNTLMETEWMLAREYAHGYAAGDKFYCWVEVDNNGVVAQQPHGLSEDGQVVTPFLTVPSPNEPPVVDPPVDYTLWQNTAVREYSDRWEAGPIGTPEVVIRKSGTIEFRKAANYFAEGTVRDLIKDGCDLFLPCNMLGWGYQMLHKPTFSGGTITVSLIDQAFHGRKLRFSAGVRDPITTNLYFIQAPLMSQASRDALFRKTAGHESDSAWDSFACESKADGTLALIPLGEAVPE